MLPSTLPPMLVQIGAELPQSEEAWAYEVKFDGFRALVYCDEAGVRVQSRNERCMTRFYPELQGLARLAGHRRLLLDGELVAFTPDGTHCFEAMQKRAGVVPDAVFFQSPRRGVHSVRPDIPVCYQIFDLLYLDGASVMGRPYRERRDLLESLELNDVHWVTPRQHRGPGARALLNASREAGLEGLVAKRLDSTYKPGRRTPHWLKFKNWKRQEFVVGGWRPDTAGAAGWLGCLLLGYYEGAQLLYAGKLEMSLAEPDMSRFRALLELLQRPDSPFTSGSSAGLARYVRPELVVDVQFLECTQGGSLRQAFFKGFVHDRDARSVRLERSKAILPTGSSRRAPAGT
jgi:bifunctional non-homologous end joining protein LigD